MHLPLFPACCSVGCNKGAHTVELFDLFAPELGLNKRSLYEAYAPLRPVMDGGSPCGACDGWTDAATGKWMEHPSEWRVM
jgi:hypothetical protein